MAAATERSFNRRGMMRHWFLAFGALIALLSVINYYVFVSLRHQIIAREESQLLQIAEVTGAAVDHIFASTKKALESIRENIGPDTTPVNAHGLLKTTAEAAPFIRALAIVRIDGHYLHSSRKFPAPNVDLSSSPIITYFASIAGASDSYYTTDPTLNKIDGKWQIISGLPTHDENGDVKTVIAAVIDPKIIYSSFMQQIKSDGGTISLVNGNLRMVASNPWNDDQIGHSMAAAPAYKKLVAANTLTVSGVVHDGDSKPEMIAAAVWLQGGRFAIAATRSLPAVLYEWRVLSRVVLGASLVIMLGLSLTAVLSIGDANRLRARGKALRESEHRLKLEKERAEHAGAIKADFLANMSHEIRTPLNGIIGYADLALEDQAVSPETRKHIGRVFEASNALRVIIDDILDFSKIEARGVDLESKVFLVGELADNCVSIVMPKAIENEIDVTSRVASDVPAALMGDAPRLRQVLINLLNNAVKFTAKGSVTLEVACIAQLDENVTLRFSVTDTGIGISEVDQKKLFQRFNQADSSISRNYGGTGLGLTISKRIVDAMQGHLQVDSQPGQGSTFWFEISLPIADPAAIDHSNQPLTQNIKPLRILSVDDVAMNRDLCKAILTRAGHRVSLADSGKAAIALAAQQTYDIILMDVQMPGMDGMEAARQIRALGGVKGKVPIIALTANVMPDQVSRYKAAGMDDHVGKPIVKSALLTMLSKWSAGQPQTGVEPVVAGPTLIPVHDDEMLEALRMMDEPELIVDFVTSLRAAIDATPKSWQDATATDDRMQMAGAAHKAVNVAGQLGFAELAECYRTLEVVCLAGEPVMPALTPLHAAIDRALPKIVNIAEAA